MSALNTVVVLAAAAAVFEWVASLLTRDYSWVDRSWSLVPIVYLWVFAGFDGFSNVRLDVMAVLVTLWGIRLTFNFARKGGYRGVEDYRWAVLRSSMTTRQFALFNVGFIVLYQNFILVLITLPAYTALEHGFSPWGVFDTVLAALFCTCTFAEALADQQQWNFQVDKQRRVSAGLAPDQPFLQTGMFRYSRHPNYFFEQAQWWILFYIGALAAHSVVQWSILGPVLLTILFIGSTSFTERISLSKYPQYALYQQRTSAIVPWFAGKVTGDGTELGGDIATSPGP